MAAKAATKTTATNTPAAPAKAPRARKPKLVAAPANAEEIAQAKLAPTTVRAPVIPVLPIEDLMLPDEIAALRQENASLVQIKIDLEGANTDLHDTVLEAHQLIEAKDRTIADLKDQLASVRSAKRFSMEELERANATWKEESKRINRLITLAMGLLDDRRVLTVQMDNAGSDLVAYWEAHKANKAAIAKIAEAGLLARIKALFVGHGIAVTEPDKPKHSKHERRGLPVYTDGQVERILDHADRREPVDTMPVEGEEA